MVASENCGSLSAKKVPRKTGQDDASLAAMLICNLAVHDMSPCVMFAKYTQRLQVLC